MANLVEPAEGSWELGGADRMEVPIRNAEPSPNRKLEILSESNTPGKSWKSTRLYLEKRRDFSRRLPGNSYAVLLDRPPGVLFFVYLFRCAPEENGKNYLQSAKEACNIV